MKKINLGHSNMHCGNLILVNKAHPIKRNYANYGASLVSVNTKYPDLLLDYVAAKELSQLMTVLKCGNDIVPVSGYRSLLEQEQIYNDSLEENGELFTKKYVALPDRSEHQTGLAIDLAEKSYNIDFIRPNFPYKGICMQFRKKAADYGYIERYSKKKVSITGIAHEPWHFRYVGYPHSEIINRLNFSLEEYIEFIKKFPYEEKHLEFVDTQNCYEIFYVKELISNSVTLFLPENIPYQISGNNIDGFIITLKKNR